AAAGRDAIIEQRTGKMSLGFNMSPTDLAPATSQAEVYTQVLPEDLLKFGLIPEFIGRLPVIAAVNSLDKDALVSILPEPRNALTRQYARLFDIDDVELEFTEDGCAAMADLAVARDT